MSPRRAFASKAHRNREFQWLFDSYPKVSYPTIEISGQLRSLARRGCRIYIGYEYTIVNDPIDIFSARIEKRKPVRAFSRRS